MKRNSVPEDAGDKGNDEKEYDDAGKETKGGGYRMEKGKLCKMKKSQDLSGDDLQKSLDKLTDFVEANDSVSRKDTLLAKAVKEDLEKSERDELHTLLGGEQAKEVAG